MPHELRCRRWGVAITPTRVNLAKGPAWYRFCPACRSPRGGTPHVFGEPSWMAGYPMEGSPMSNENPFVIAEPP
jgi:hypothetical protein